MPSVLITGSSTGIGEECALRLNRMGWHVFAGVRREEDGAELKAKAANGSRMTPVLLDVTDSESIRDAMQIISKATGEHGLRGLVNNAGIAVAAPLEFIPIEELRKQMDVNVVGQIAVTQAAIPLLRKARGRIVNIGSVSGRISTPMIGPYAASKFALDSLSDTLRMELKPWHIHVAYVQPSGVATPIWRKTLKEADRMRGLLPSNAYALYGPMMDYMQNMAANADRSGLHVSAVGKAVARALAWSRPRTRYSVGSTAHIGEVLRMLPDKVRNSLILRQFK